MRRWNFVDAAFGNISRLREVKEMRRPRNAKTQAERRQDDRIFVAREGKHVFSPADVRFVFLFPSVQRSALARGRWIERREIALFRRCSYASRSRLIRKTGVNGSNRSREIRKKVDDFFFVWRDDIVALGFESTRLNITRGVARS